MKSAGGAPPTPQCDWAEPALSFEDLVRRNTGWAQTPERWREQRRRRQLLEAETARIADALEAEGIPVRLGGGDIVALGDVIGLVVPVESFRLIRILPVIAQRDRRPMLNALRYYQRHNPFGSYLRLVVVTSGQRVPLGSDLRGRMRGCTERAAASLTKLESASASR